MGQCDGGFEVDACQFDGAGAGFGELKFAFDGRGGLDCLKGVCAVMRCYFLLYCQVDGAVDYFGDGVVSGKRESGILKHCITIMKP